MAERRIRLTSKQFDHYSTSRRQATELVNAAEAAREKLATVAELILDAYGVDPAAKVTVDDKTRELVIAVDPVPDAPAPTEPTVTVVPPAEVAAEAPAESTE